MWPPVGKSRRASEDMTNSDVLEDRLIEVLDQLEREVPDYLLDE